MDIGSHTFKSAADISDSFAGTADNALVTTTDADHNGDVCGNDSIYTVVPYTN